ncbi:MAG: hypothetical protein H0T42_03300 [Deltaproteobacteria bacterium]|nr:hypothetical protein [Deltaproteobacteria bacterium]
MNPRFALVVGAFGLLSVIGSEAAEARGRGRVWFGGGGGIRVHAGASVHWSRPAPVYRPRSSWSVGGSIYVGSPAPRYRYYRPYYYTDAYVPSYYGTSYYPVAPAPQPGYIVAVAPRPRLPKLGIGLFAGGSSTEEVSESSDLGLLGRLRLGNGGLLIEGELGKTSYESDLRVDRRLGASLVYEIGARNRFAPYVLGGFGVQQADVAGEYNTTQNFAELGIGLRYAITPKFHLAVDVRAGTRNTMSSDDPSTRPVEGTIARTVAPPSSDSDESEEYTRARLSAILYF